jgi:hypothetical protein
MTAKSTDTGVLTALAQRLADQRLPRARAMQERVNRGEPLSDRDVAFLEEVLEDARKIAPILSRNPKFEEAARTMAGLYREIMAKALENENAKKA